MLLKVTNNKHGATSIFLSIILSALILIECTYVVYVCNLDRRLTYSRAVKLQVESYLADYNRELFRTYGIYAFDKNSVDDYVFRQILAANGIDEGISIVVSGLDEFSVDNLRSVISEFYAYRSSGILFNQISDYVSYFLEQIDSYGIVDNIRSLFDYADSEILISIFNGIEDISSLLENFEDISDSISYLTQIIDSFTNISSSIGSDFELDDFDFFVNAISNIMSIYDAQSLFIDDYFFHPFAVNYAVYNFDSRLENDELIDGTLCSDIHDSNMSDIEYILTGLSDGTSENLTAFYIFQLAFVKNIVSILLDTTLMETITAAADVISVTVLAISGGLVPIPPEVIIAIIIAIDAVISSYSDLNSLLDGDSISFIEVEDLPVISLTYRDFVAFFMSVIPDSTLLERMVYILNRDYPWMAVNVSVNCNSTFYEFNYSDRYELYV